MQGELCFDQVSYFCVESILNAPAGELEEELHDFECRVSVRVQHIPSLLENIQERSQQTKYVLMK